MSTNVISPDSILIRNEWVQSEMMKSVNESRWFPYIGDSSDSPIYRKNTTMMPGQTSTRITFDYLGNLTNRPIIGDATASGTGETIRKFSNELQTQKYRFTVDYGSDWLSAKVGEGYSIDDLGMRIAADTAQRWSFAKDQMLYDTAQGLIAPRTTKKAQDATHIIDVGSTFDWNTLIEIETKLATSQYTTGGTRVPLDPVRIGSEMDGVDYCWILMIDQQMAQSLKQDSKFQNIVSQADYRGSENRVFKSALGKIGQLLIIQCPTFYADVEAYTAPGWLAVDSTVVRTGLRQYKGNDPKTALWTGNVGFQASTAARHSRGIVLGKGAMQYGISRMPTVKTETRDIKNFLEASIEIWVECQKTVLTSENIDYQQTNFGGIDYGVVAIDYTVP